MSVEGPRRLLDGGGDERNALLRGALEAERAERTDEARLARIGQALAFAGASVAPPPLAEAATPPAPAAAARSATGWLVAKGPYVLLATAIVGGLVAIGKSDPPASPASPARTTVVSPPVDEPVADTTPTLSPADLPSAPAPATPLPGKNAKLAASSTAGDSDEIALLAKAHDALRADPARALSLCKEHETRFRGGHFAQEREAVAIEALTYLGRKDEASRRWALFQARYPSSSHRVHLEGLFGAPPPPALSP